VHGEPVEEVTAAARAFALDQHRVRLVVEQRLAMLGEPVLVGLVRGEVGTLEPCFALRFGQLGARPDFVHALRAPAAAADGLLGDGRISRPARGSLGPRPVDASPVVEAFVWLVATPMARIFSGGSDGWFLELPFQGGFALRPPRRHKGRSLEKTVAMDGVHARYARLGPVLGSASGAAK
jgi:hypothetical protein